MRLSFLIITVTTQDTHFPNEIPFNFKLVHLCTLRYVCERLNWIPNVYFYG
jgi:hypothetical protein